MIRTFIHVCLYSALDVLEITRRSGASAIVKLIEDTGLAKTLQTTQNLTLFAPSDAAIGVSSVNDIFWGRL